MKEVGMYFLNGGLGTIPVDDGIVNKCHQLISSDGLSLLEGTEVIGGQVIDTPIQWVEIYAEMFLGDRIDVMRLL
jgi:hypothetical protein